MILGDGVFGTCLEHEGSSFISGLIHFQIDGLIHYHGSGFFIQVSSLASLLCLSHLIR